MINKTIIIIAISINFTFQISFIFCTVHRTPQVYRRKSATQVELSKDFIQRKSLKHRDIFPEKEIWGSIEEQIKKALNSNEDESATPITTSIPAEANTNHETKQEGNVRRELKHSENTGDQPYLQKKPEVDTSLMARYADEIEQWKANIEKKQNLRGGTSELEDMNEEDLEREIRMWKEGNKDKPIQDWQENYSQQGQPLAGNVEKFTYKQEERDEGSDQNENKNANDTLQFTEQDVEKQIRLWTDAHPNEKIKELLKEDEPMDDTTVGIHDKKEEPEKTLSSSERKALQWKEILLKTNSEGKLITKTKTENKVRQKLAEIMSSEDKNQENAKKMEFVKAMTNIANSTKIKIKELLKQQMKHQMGNNSLATVNSKKKSLRNSFSKHTRSSNKPPEKCVQKCFAPKCEVECLGRRGSAACSAKACSALTKGPDSASLCTGELCHAMCFKQLCIAACEGPVCFAKCHGKTCHAVANGRASQSTCMKDECMAYATGDEVDTKCKGAKCQAQCLGLKCEARCDGTNCIAECRGEKCRAQCTGKNCQKSINPGSGIKETPIVKPDYIEGDITSDEDVSTLKEEDGGIDNQGANYDGPSGIDDATNDDKNLSLGYAINVKLTEEFIESIKKKLYDLKNNNLLRLLPQTLSNI